MKSESAVNLAVHFNKIARNQTVQVVIRRNKGIWVNLLKIYVYRVLKKNSLFKIVLSFETPCTKYVPP